MTSHNTASYEQLTNYRHVATNSKLSGTGHHRNLCERQRHRRACPARSKSNASHPARKMRSAYQRSGRRMSSSAQAFQNALRGRGSGNTRPQDSPAPAQLATPRGIGPRPALQASCPALRACGGGAWIRWDTTDRTGLHEGIGHAPHRVQEAQGPVLPEVSRHVEQPISRAGRGAPSRVEDRTAKGGDDANGGGADHQATAAPSTTLLVPHQSGICSSMNKAASAGRGGRG